MHAHIQYMLTSMHTHTYTWTKIHARIMDLHFRYQIIYVSFILKRNKRAHVSSVKYIPVTHTHICNPYEAYSYKDLSSREIILYVSMYTRVVHTQTRAPLRQGRQPNKQTHMFTSRQRQGNDGKQVCRVAPIEK